MSDIGVVAELSHELDEDWEEWDPSKGSFVTHMIAGSMAGLAEHVVIFPIDTIKTHVQCQRCPNSTGAFSAIPKARELVRQEGVIRLWRGVGTMFWGCIPAHATYFSLFELSKKGFGADQPGHHPLAAAMAGGLSTTAHDAIMTPLDVVKQRLQLGYYKGALDCFRSIIRHDGYRALYLSFPTTLAMNIPYGMVMVAMNESLKKILNPSGEQNMLAFLLAGAGAGATAAAVTNPLDVAKTRLQTQMLVGRPAEAVAAKCMKSCPSVPSPAFAGATESTLGATKMPKALQYRGFIDVVSQISAQEGWRGFFRGVGPRLLVHTPSVAISWSTYETLKRLLQ